MINYATEEAMEDAFVAYLKTRVDGSINVIAAMTAAELTYPCIIVTAQSSDNVNDASDWNEHRIFELEVKLGVEATDPATLRERNRVLRDSVMEALTDSGAIDAINGTGLIRISRMLFGKITRGAEGHIMETVIPIAVTA